MTGANCAVKRLGAALLGVMALWMAAASGGEERPPQRALNIAPRQHRPMILRERHGSNVTSGNWSGYAVTGADGSVSDVKASWIVPPIQGGQGGCSSQTQYASFWVGIDGYSTSTVEQIGTDSDCSNGSPSYYAWYEFFPKFPYVIPTPIKVGDKISAEVSYSGGKFTVSILDVTTGRSWSTSAKEPNAKQASAEWIIEASGGAPLADFGTVYFGKDSTGVSPTCDATVGNNVNEPIGSFANVVTITMVTSGGTVMSLPSALSADGTSFTDNWANAGP